MSNWEWVGLGACVVWFVIVGVIYWRANLEYEASESRRGEGDG